MDTLSRLNPVFTLKHDDWRRLNVLLTAWRRTPEAVITTFAPALFIGAITRAAGEVMREGGHGSNGDRARHCWGSVHSCPW